MACRTGHMGVRVVNHNLDTVRLTCDLGGGIIWNHEAVPYCSPW